MDNKAVISSLDGLFGRHGAPAYLRSDNGCERIPRAEIVLAMLSLPGNGQHTTASHLRVLVIPRFAFTTATLSAIADAPGAHLFAYRLFCCQLDC